ncbi:hypothetical protein DB345_08130 [Spartobacteria bacterium LR76]|nr:hypothetical protein DB345_08130 [Spartobacteria bacterium LR76]
MTTKRPVQKWAQQKRLKFFKEYFSPEKRVLEIGSGSGWLAPALREMGITRYTSLDLFPPADIVGDVNQWKSLGLAAESFDVIVAFEIVEHVDCFKACHDLLAPGGVVLVTTPIPETDWVLKITEGLGLNQKRTSPHSNLVHLNKVPYFSEKRIKIVMGLGQWGTLRK